MTGLIHMTQEFRKSLLISGGCFFTCLFSLRLQSDHDLWGGLIGWWDIYVVSLLSLLPAHIIAMAMLSRSLSHTLRSFLQAAFLGISVASFGLFLFHSRFTPTESLVNANWVLAAILREIIIVPMAWTISQSSGVQEAFRSSQWGWSLLAISTAFAIPFSYEAARSKSDIARLERLLEQSRFGEANRLAHQLAQSTPDRLLYGKTLRQLAKETEETVKQLERSIVSLSSQGSITEHLEQVRCLAMLGRPLEALRLFETGQQPLSSEAWNLIGTIHETLEDWKEAEFNYRAAYQSCDQSWAQESSSIQQPAALIRSLTGMAYAQRKQGHYADAEKTYQELWKISPTGETSFLLAQFYEDTQQTEQSLKYLQHAVSLNPSHFQDSGQRLIEKLRTGHFGCFRIPGGSP